MEQKLNLIHQIASMKSKIELFENKYKCSFEEFEKRIMTKGEEDFEEWDDYIEWKAYIEISKDLENKLQELKELENFNEMVDNLNLPSFKGASVEVNDKGCC